MLDVIIERLVVRHPLSHRLLAHRGLWQSDVAPNSHAALVAAARAGFGIETDLRDLAGSLVISHDPAKIDSLHALESLRAISEAASAPITLALNVKSDGLAPLLAPILEVVGCNTVFFFDMSVPQLVTYARSNLPVAIRISEFEPFRPALLEQLGGLPLRIWLDSFDSDWWLDDSTINQLSMSATMTIVSPEIHGRDPRPVWDWFMSATREGADVYLCTDSPNLVLELYS